MLKWLKNCCYISRGLFRLVGVRSVGWVVRDARHAPPRQHTAQQPAEITRVISNNKFLIILT
jgi:hypothetical protein